MRGNVKVIKFTAAMSILFFILTYFTAVNIETHMLELNTIWLSNNLVFTVFGGAFASMFVILICEIQKYITAKASMENYIFYQALYLYRALFLMQQNISDYQKNTEADVPNNLLDETSRMIQNEIFALQSADYAPLKKNLLLTAHQKFCREATKKFLPILQSSNAIKIAINEVKINYLRQNDLNKIVTSADEPLQTVLKIQFDRVSNALKEVDRYLKDIDMYCKQRYDWEKQRKLIQSGYVNIFEAWNFEREFPKET